MINLRREGQVTLPAGVQDLQAFGRGALVVLSNGIAVVEGSRVSFLESAPVVSAAANYPKFVFYRKDERAVEYVDLSSNVKRKLFVDPTSQLAIVKLEEEGVDLVVLCWGDSCFPTTVYGQLLEPLKIGDEVASIKALNDKLYVLTQSGELKVFVWNSDGFVNSLSVDVGSAFDIRVCNNLVGLIHFTSRVIDLNRFHSMCVCESSSMDFNGSCSLVAYVSNGSVHVLDLSTKDKAVIQGSFELVAWSSHLYASTGSSLHVFKVEKEIRRPLLKELKVDFKFKFDAELPFCAAVGKSSALYGTLGKLVIYNFNGRRMIKRIRGVPKKALYYNGSYYVLALRSGLSGVIEVSNGPPRALFEGPFRSLSVTSKGPIACSPTECVGKSFKVRVRGGALVSALEVNDDIYVAVLSNGSNVVVEGDISASARVSGAALISRNSTINLPMNRLSEICSAGDNVFAISDNKLFKINNNDIKQISTNVNTISCGKDFVVALKDLGDRGGHAVVLGEGKEVSLEHGVLSIGAWDSFVAIGRPKELKVYSVLDLSSPLFVLEMARNELRRGNLHKVSSLLSKFNPLELPHSQIPKALQLLQEMENELVKMIRG